MEAFAHTELDDRTGELMGSCLGTPVVLRQLLQHFSDKDLIELSLVNKQWNYEARSVLKDRGTLAARISSGYSNEDLVAFATDLEKMRVVPFSGLCVELYHDLAHICRPASHASYDVILERLPIKKLSIEFPWDWDKCTDCPAFLLVERILEKFGGVLKGLSFTFQWNQVHTVQHCFTSWSFPRLKILELDAENTDDNFTRFVKKLVSVAPSLQELKMVREICFDENVLEGSSAVLVPCTRHFGDFNPLYERVCENLISALRPGTIEICSRHFQDNFSEEILNTLIPNVLRVSVNTLHTLKMDLLFAVPLMCYGICLENVTTLEIRLALRILESLEPRTLTLLKRFDFTRVFPKVDKVTIKNELNSVFLAETIDPFLEQGNALLMLTENLQDRAINIKHLLMRYFRSDSTVLLVAQMFPNVITVSVETQGYIGPTPFPSMWEHFQDLHELTLTSCARAHWIKNVDSVFCGIFPEEVAELREKDDEYLKAVNIVPVMPSITCMKNLRTFTFQYTPELHHSWYGTGTPDFWFSKITGFLGFARCPALHVTFQTALQHCAESLSHMEPFATFTLLDDFLD